MKPSKITRDGNLIALENESHLLQGLAQFQVLRRQELALWGWPERDFETAYLMARRTLKRLVEDDAVWSVKLPRKGELFGMTVRGAQRLRFEGHEADATSKDVAHSKQIFHRMLGTMYLLHERAETGAQVAAETAVRRGDGLTDKRFWLDTFKKAPDGLVYRSKHVPGIMRLVDVCETEWSVKGYAELCAVFDTIRKRDVLQDAGMILNSVVMVMAAGQGHEARIKAALWRYVEESKVDPRMFYPALRFVRVTLGKSFSIKGYEYLTSVDL